MLIVETVIEFLHNLEVGQSEIRSGFKGIDDLSSESSTACTSGWVRTSSPELGESLEFSSEYREVGGNVGDNWRGVNSSNVVNSGEAQDFSIGREAGEGVRVQRSNQGCDWRDSAEDCQGVRCLLEERGKEIDNGSGISRIDAADDGGWVSETVSSVETVEELLENSLVGINSLKKRVTRKGLNDGLSESSTTCTSGWVRTSSPELGEALEFSGEYREVGGNVGDNCRGVNSSNIVNSGEAQDFSIGREAGKSVRVQRGN